MTFVTFVFKEKGKPVKISVASFVLVSKKKTKTKSNFVTSLFEKELENGQNSRTQKPPVLSLKQPVVTICFFLFSCMTFFNRLLFFVEHTVFDVFF